MEVLRPAAEPFPHTGPAAERMHAMLHCKTVAHLRAQHGLAIHNVHRMQGRQLKLLALNCNLHGLHSIAEWLQRLTSIAQVRQQATSRQSSHRAWWQEL